MGMATRESATEAGAPMLTIRLDINGVGVDEIHVQNIGSAGDGCCWYAIRKPAVPGRIRHRVADGAVGLAALVTTALADAGYGRVTPLDVTRSEP
jgi:hypothetical protein